MLSRAIRRKAILYSINSRAG